MNKINLIAFIIVLGATFYSCGKSFKGRIEKREMGKVFLVNTSHSKLFIFTVRIKSITNDSIYNYRTEIVKLLPGDEKYLGDETEDEYVGIGEKMINDSGIVVEKIPPPPNLIKHTYEVMGQFEPTPTKTKL